MLCYRDMTFCAANCTKRNCFRHKAQLPEKPPLPVMQTDYSAVCAEYEEDKD